MDKYINLNLKYLVKYPESKKNYHLKINQIEPDFNNYFKFDINDFKSLLDGS